MRILFILLFVAYHTISAQQSIGTLYERMKSGDSATAFDAYRNLLEQEPESVSNFFKTEKKRYPFDGSKYVNLLYLNSDIVPENRIIHFYKKHNIRYTSDSLEIFIKSLFRNMNAYERIRMEDQMLQRLTMADIPALEYYGILFGNFGDSYRGFSSCVDDGIARMLDVLYDRSWNELVESDAALYAYVYQCHVYPQYLSTNFGKYYMRFKFQPIRTRERLHALYLKETAPDMKASLLLCLKLCEIQLEETKRCLLFGTSTSCS